MMAAVEGVPDVAFRTDESELDDVREDVMGFIQERVEDAEADGVIVCMSGGIDSTLTAHLCVEALGADRVTALVLPATLTDTENSLDALSTAEDLGLDPTMIQLQPLLGAFRDTVGSEIESESSRVATGNVTARLRMAAAYYAANVTNRLVCGTANRTELLVGYFTKYGDGAADVRPIAGLYKTEVRALARHVDVSPSIVEKTPTAGLWAGQTDESELGVPYGLLDIILHKLVDEDFGIEGTATELGIDESIVGQYAHMVVETQHKRVPAPIPETDRIDVIGLFCELEERV